MDTDAVIMLFAIFAVAVMYSSVGHGGASGYLAVMAFWAVVPEVIRPTALVLNVFVASIAAVQFWRSGNFSWRLFWPFAAASIPAAYVGGLIYLPTHIYKIVLGGVLVIAAVRLAWKLAADSEIKAPPLGLSLAVGAVIGLLSGMVGVGGGIFLTPVLLLMGWSETRTAAGVSAMFILVNSIAGLVAQYDKLGSLPSAAWMWVAAAVAGGVIGSTLGGRRFDSLTMRRVLACVLVFAGIKLVFV